MLRLLFGFPGSAALVQTCTQDRTKEANQQQKGSMDDAMLPRNYTGGESGKWHTGQVSVGWVRQLTRGMPSLVPVPMKMSSDCSRLSSSAAEEPETAPPPGDARARATPLQKERAGRETNKQTPREALRRAADTRPRRR